MHKQVQVLKNPITMKTQILLKSKRFKLCMSTILQSDWYSASSHVALCFTPCTWFLKKKLEDIAAKTVALAFV